MCKCTFIRNDVITCLYNSTGFNLRGSAMILIVFGLPGTGKSFLSARLAEDIKAGYLNTDIIREQTGKKGQYDEETRLFVYQKMKEKMIHYIYENQHCIVDGTFQKKKYREIFLREMRQRNAVYTFIQTVADQEVVKNRMKESRKHSEADFSIYLKIKKNFEPLTSPHLTLRTDKQELPEMVETIKEYISYDQ